MNMLVIGNARLAGIFGERNELHYRTGEFALLSQYLCNAHHSICAELN